MTPKEKLSIIVANLTTAKHLMTRTIDGVGSVNLEDELSVSGAGLSELENALLVILPKLVDQLAQEP